ncbi:MAG: hypothetical protein QM809_10835 [Gordonia sp. (in: high G+C Gram-positive bacteria)]|uniref:hypothetical protein n=1 Tax=Gordonia sp. (in: high G+C Gram-positive bacteria) TaxID=84139 RepID=UPI0039E5111B
MGLLALLLPVVAVSTGAAGIVLATGGGAGAATALALGAGVLLAAILWPVLRWLHRSGRESVQTVIGAGTRVRIVEPVRPGGLGVATATTPNGTVDLTVVTRDDALAPGADAYVIGPAPDTADPAAPTAWEVAVFDRP